MTPEAKAREIAVTNGWPAHSRDTLPKWAIRALIEALHFQPLPEWSDKPMTCNCTTAPCVHNDPDLATGCADDFLPGSAEQWRAAIPPKPNELPEWDWIKIAKAAGEHGIRYRTNSALLAFFADCGLVERGQKVDPVVEAVSAIADRGGITINRNRASDVVPAFVKDLRAELEKRGFTIKHLRSEGLLKEVGQ